MSKAFGVCWRIMRIMDDNVCVVLFAMVVSMMRHVNTWHTHTVRGLYVEPRETLENKQK